VATIGSLAVNIVATTDKFIAGIHNAQGVLAGFVKKTSLAGAAVTAAFAGMLKKFESAGSQLFDLSKSTGLSVEKLSFLKFAAEQSGTSLSVMTKAARELQKDGIDPNKFEDIARSIAGITDPTKRAQAAFEAFGIRSGQALLPMLKDIPELQKRFQSLGGEFTTKMATAADSLGDSMGELRLVLSNIGHTIAAEVAPVVTDLTKFITDNVGHSCPGALRHQHCNFGCNKVYCRPAYRGSGSKRPPANSGARSPGSRRCGGTFVFQTGHTIT
jgi:hypothetical protein